MMTDDEMIFFGAAILLARMLDPSKQIDPENFDREIHTAVTYAHFLHGEVKKRGETMKSNPRLTLTEYLQKEGKT